MSLKNQVGFLALSTFFLLGPRDVIAAIEIRDTQGVRITTDSVANTVSLQKIGTSYIYVYDYKNGVAKVFLNGAIVHQEPLINGYLEYGGGVSYSANRLKSFGGKAAGIPRPPEQIANFLLDPYPCQLSPCPPGSMPGPNPWYTPEWLPDFPEYTVHQPPDAPWGDPPAGVDPLQAQIDYQNWENWRDQECATAHSAWTALGIIGGAAATFGSCAEAVATGGLATPICVGAGAGTAALIGRANEADDNCHSSYPGYREWP